MSIRTEIEEVNTEVVAEIASLRPQTFDTYIGQENTKKNLRTAISAAKMRKTALGHVLFYGPPGLGKTTMAKVISNEMGCHMRQISGPCIEKTGDLVAVLSVLEKGDILFIDEIHRMPKFVEETLYSAMEDFRVDILVGTGPQAKVISMDLEPFTLIGATTKTGLLSAPLRDRFAMIFNMEYYTEPELMKIIINSADKLGMSMDEAGAAAIASVCRSTPRIANNITKRVLDVLLVEKKKATKKNVEAALEAIGYYAGGLTKIDIQYLSFLLGTKNKGIGLKTMSSYLGETIDTISESIEPFLIRSGYILITPQGRVLTEKGRKEAEDAAICA